MVPLGKRENYRMHLFMQQLVHPLCLLSANHVTYFTKQTSALMTT
jgi:hypothetical protein